MARKTQARQDLDASICSVNYELGFDMDKQRKWPLFAILTVIALTIYNILPTIFYYSRPLKEPIEAEAAKEISTSITERVNQLEESSQEWIYSFCNLLKIKPKEIKLHPENPQSLTVSFIKSEEAAQFRAFFPRAGSLIPFAPAQLSLASRIEHGFDVAIQRKIPVHLQENFFSFSPKDDKQILEDRVQQLGTALAGPSEQALYVAHLQKGASPYALVESLAAEINTLSKIFGDESPIAARYAARFTQGHFANRSVAIESLIQAFDTVRDDLLKAQMRLRDEENKNEDKEQNILLLEKKEKDCLSAENYLKKHLAQFSSGQEPWKAAAISLESSINLGNRNPLFSTILIDSAKDQIVLKFHPDVIEFRANGKNRELFEQLLVNEIAKISRLSNEKLISGATEATIPLYSLTNPSGFLVLNLEKIGRSQEKQLQSTLNSLWHPKHPDLQDIQVVDFKTYQTLSEEQKALCFIAISPLSLPNHLNQGLQNDSLYLIGKGIAQIAQNYAEFPDSELAQTLQADFQSLSQIMYENGFAPRSAASSLSDLLHSGDILFEKNEWASALIAATRENFSIRGTKKYALLELGDREQRILTQNKIETAIHEELIKWKEDYQAAKVSLDPRVKFDVPEPTRSPLWNNCILSLKKMIRGDERKIIRWGLDLSGGKTVQIELRDQNHRVVTDDQDIHQGINELYGRINKMGLSEVSIRQIGTNIVLDFPSSQALSASELIKASSMYFHVVNEKFSTANDLLAENVHRFLFEVWNEASVSDKKDPLSVNLIAYAHLHEEALRSEAAKTLWEHGLRFELPLNSTSTNTLDTSLSKIGILRGSHPSEWHGQNHPLMILFSNYVMEGSNLENIHAGYDNSKGNYLNFEVRKAYYTKENQQINPRKALLSWTSTFSKEKVLGTALENSTKGRGWRMAVLLNDTIINCPTLDSPLETGGMISGSFSQSEVNQLAADLKTGSLTFTPHILSEKNVSPELGKQDRMKGITATLAAFALIVCAMIAYYRFAGVVASVAVFFNLLILWATLQNLGATLSLAGLAGVILTVGMAVDANVLVFERIKEEFALSGKISSALSIGYQKAYSAIIDSNITTIIAAIILLNFDAGPIKSFAINLIIGIVSSMFTALFMTKVYFVGWAQNPKNKELKMAHWIQNTRIDFLKHSRAAAIFASIIILVGGFLIFGKKTSIFGMDFTGGYAINLEIDPAAAGETSYLERAEKALLAAKIAPSDFQIRELHPNNHLRILFGTSIEQSGKPFFNLPIEIDQPNAKFNFEKNPRIQWILNALQNENLHLSPSSLSQLDTNWTAMSGQMSNTMRNNALYGLLISFVCIFIYLSFRFEYKFAAAALICLFHDVLITLGSIGLLHALKIPIQIDLNTIAALMTIVGYSLNDTIIIFDRIREELHTKRNIRFPDLVNNALNATLSRTTITSGTTLLVLITLVAIGGPSIFSFSLVMTIGVFFGTLSSWFIASPLILFFQKKEEEKEALSTN